MADEAQLIRDFQEYAWKFWGGHGCPCVRCWDVSVTLHEIKPRSLYREWYTDVMNSVPICNDCHEWAGMSGKEGRDELRRHAAEYLNEQQQREIQEDADQPDWSGWSDIDHDLKTDAPGG